ncbi:hypothetical protein CVT24_011703 [Panaeolus cyanescens]|uniref:ABC transporter domain-containing protein n=1 Tax=Panaeolus cyanescens TaxID=181874 RepID=A0A409YH72_9AGAR|nr:hypothetical protein CVT24_011703 [Panaeolus cyanescens]
MANVLWLQFRALIWKNWIVLAKRPVISILRAFLLPVLYGAFLATAQVFLNRLNNYGLGSPVSIYSLQNQFDATTTLIWADGTNGSSNPTPQAIIDHITSNFTPHQLSAVRKLDNPADIPRTCPQNFNFFSECFAAIAFFDIPGSGSTGRTVNYTIYADAGLTSIDVEKHTSDFEKRIFPLQWSIDQAIIELQTGVQPQTPLEWPYSQETNEEQLTNIRLSYIRGIRDLVAIGLFIAFIGIAYQLPGSVAGERAMLITDHMRAMGLLDSARILSWHIGISLSYLPAWIIVALIWKFRIFEASNAGLIVILHLLLGLSLASWSFFVAAPFGKSPQLAAVVTTFLGIVFAILGVVIKSSRTGTLVIFSLLFPPSFYIFALRGIAGYENHQLPTNILKKDPDTGIVVLPLLIAAVIDVFLWPYLAVLWERRMYSIRVPSQKPKRRWFWQKSSLVDPVPQVPVGVAVSIRNLTKIYKTSRFSSKGDVTAVSNLSLDIPKTGIFVLLGSNGAGKSTSLSVIAGLSQLTSGSVTFEGGRYSPPRGTLGIVPQKNVLFPDLTCLQTLQVWKAVKWSENSEADEDLEQLLKDCDLEKKIHANAATMSGGQKRKLQLAIGLLGGSKIVLVDECTSGVDPLSRRALWKTLTAFRDDRSIVFTTHFLDEADLLADHIAILAAPGKVVASGSPVSLKRDLGEGYTIQVAFNSSVDQEKLDSSRLDELLGRIKELAPRTHVSVPSAFQLSYHLRSKDMDVIRQVLELIDQEKGTYGIVSYDILGTTIEDIFLDLMAKNDAALGETSEHSISAAEKPKPALELATGRPVSPFRQAFTIFHKRYLIARRSWLTPLLTILVAVCGACIPLALITGRQQSCVVRFRNATSIPLYLPGSVVSPIIPFTFGPSSRTVQNPPNIIETLGSSTELFRTTDVNSKQEFVDLFNRDYRNLSVGGLSFDFNTGETLIAWEASPPGLKGAALLNLASNILYNRALNATGNEDRTPTLIRANYAAFPPVAAGTLVSLRWMVFFGAVMAVYPAFYSLYVSKERRTSVQAMQLSNGLTDPIGMWLGHLMFDTISVVILSTIIAIIFATASNQFHGVGFLWLVLVLYGITGALFSYCVSLMVSSPLAAFATGAGYQFVIFILYLSSYLLILTYGKTTESSKLITIVHFTTSITAPVASVTRAGLVAVNLFGLSCSGNEVVTTASLGSIKRYGGPILYLIIYSIVLFVLLVWADSGSRTRRRPVRSGVSSGTGTAASSKEDVLAAAKAVASSDDLLRVLNVSKRYGDNQVVDDVSLGVGKDTVFALLGPNGAGKTTTFNIIRGDVLPDSGDVVINGTSVVSNPRLARSSLGVCPQFTAIDSQLTVREHLLIYGRLKGLAKGPELDESIEAIMQGTSLSMYADRLASKLSGGNQRKLALAIALIGNPSVILIDEFSTGIDPKMKRDMWQTLRRVAVGKAVVITTHSMEEASALANSVGILAKRVLAVGTTQSLSERYATYEVHFTCRTREEVVKARTLMTLIPGSRMADDVATRFEVPIDSSDGNSLGKLFNTLATRGEFTEYTVEKATLESVFLKVIRENNVREEDSDQTKRKQWWKSHWLLNVLRCLIFPVAFGLFLAYAQNFFASPTNYGVGTAIPLFAPQDHFDGSRPIIWMDQTDGSGFVKAEDIMKHVTSNFTTRQLQAVREVSSMDELTRACVTNFGGASNCYLAVTFEGIPRAPDQGLGNVNYTIRGDDGAYRIDVLKHTSGYETKVAPMQWAIDRAIIELTTGASLPTPVQQPFTFQTNSDTFDDRRLFYIGLMGSFGGIAFFVAFTGIIYQLSGSLALERSALITSHMQAMGALDSARIVSWHLSTCLLYIPTWLILAGLWHATLFHRAGAGVLILVHLLTGFNLASWSLFFSVPFSKSPQLAAAVTTLVALVLAVVPLVLFFEIGAVLPAVLTFFFPPMFYVFALKNMSSFEGSGVPTSFSEPDPIYFTQLSGMIIAAVFAMFFWPAMAVVFERVMYGVWNPTNSSFWKKKPSAPQPLTTGVSIRIENLRKVFKIRRFLRRSTRVEAIENLTIDIPTYGIYTLLGPNGAGKSTTLAVIAGLTQATEGTVTFEGDVSRPPHGTLGVVPQKNVLFAELTCLENLKIWNTIKSPDGTYSLEELEQLLADCDLHEKAHSRAGTLSGGQKRKLQLAIGLVGGSKIILVDECTSGVDPLSRRALWRTLSKYRNERTIILTTHFLDEADFLADRIAVLAAPGRLIAADSPVALKSSKGDGYSVHVQISPGFPQTPSKLLGLIRQILPSASHSIDAGRLIYHLHSKETSEVSKVLKLVETSKAELGITSYDAVGTSIEDIFLDLLEKEKEAAMDSAKPSNSSTLVQLQLSTGRAVSPLSQAMTVFYKRLLVFRRSWLGLLLALAVGISGAWWPIRFVTGSTVECGRVERGIDMDQAFWPPYFANSSVMVTPPSLVSVINATLPEVSINRFGDRDSPFNPYFPVPDIQTFKQNVGDTYYRGGLALDLERDDYFISWNIQWGSLDMFSLTSNTFFGRALNPTNATQVSRLVPSLSRLPTMNSESLETLQWLAIFGAAMSVFPAFFTLYVAKERFSSVQAMQLSNGLSNPLGLWLGHFLFDSMFSVIIATVIAIVYGTVRGDKFQGVGILWLIICLYGFAGTLLSYVAAIVIKSPVGAFSAVVISQFIIYLLYLVGYIVTLFSAPPSAITRTMNTIGFTMGFLAPINNLVRAALISVNQFGLLCDGDKLASGTGLVAITRYGGPILYLVVWICALLFALAQVDTGIVLTLSPKLQRKVPRSIDADTKSSRPSDVAEEAEHAVNDATHPLRVMGVSKAFGRNLVVDDVSFTIPSKSLFVMLGPNGAGKTTTFDMILANSFYLVNNRSTVFDKRNARASLGVCPQFTAMDSHLTVKEHLLVYGRLKGLRGQALADDVDNIMKATGLDSFADRLATKLSGGNQRKLSLAIAFIGNPSVVLIDEYSTGIDAKMKRELWEMLKHVAKDKSVFLTTHSMEEASYLATKVGIMSKRMLAIGTPQDLESRNASYEVHFSCHSRAGVTAMQTLMAKIPGARMVDDVATRFQVPIRTNDDIGSESSLTVAGLFDILASEKEMFAFTVGKSTLETAFIKIINDAANAEVGLELETSKRRKFLGLCW